MHLSRRKFLLANGAALALPVLPSLGLEPKLKPNNPSKKMVIMYVPNGLVRRCFIPGEQQADLPGFKTVRGSESNRKAAEAKPTGVHPLELTSTMQPLAEHKDRITLLTGLDRPYKSGGDAHEQGSSCYLTSVTPQEAEEKKLRFLQGRTLDHVVGEQVGRNTPFKTLEISCNGFTQPKESFRFDNISWYDVNKVAPSIKNPRKLYDRLFASNIQRRHLKDMTDLIRADAKSLSTKLNSHDRATLDEFTTMIRDIEVRNARLEKMIAQVGVTQPVDAILPRGEYIRLQVDLMLVALQTGITNVSTLMIGPERWDAPMLYEKVFDKPVVHHNLSHNQKGDGYKKLQKIDLFHMEIYAYLLSRMRGIKEADGSSLLDNSIVVCGVGLGDGATHQYFDLPMILAGGAQGGLKHGRHIQCANGTPISNVWLSFAQKMGVQIDQYADSTGPMSNL